MSREKTIKLSKPTKKQAKKNLEEVSYEDRISGIKMHSMAGNQRHPLQSLRDVANFIKMPNKKNLLKAGGPTVNYIDPSVLVDWIENVIGDKELASEIDNYIGNEENFKEIAEIINELIDKRIYQSKKVIEEDN